MNRIIFIILALCLGNIAQAQNANRSGFFIEAGIGGLTGTTPISTMYFDGIHVIAEHIDGAGANLHLGYRLKTSNHFAIDFRGGAIVPFESTKFIQVFKIMPGIRYTSKELYKNISVYAGIAFGATYSRTRKNYSFHHVEDIELEDFITVGEKLDPDKIVYLTPNKIKVSFGLGTLITVGLNLTNNIYIGASYEQNYPFAYDRPYNLDGIKYRWGMIGAQIGYRF